MPILAVESSNKRLAQQKRHSVDRAMRWVILTIFCVGLGLPMLGTFTSIGQTWQLSEKRRLANIPWIHSASFGDLLAYVDGSRAFARDRFGFRSALIKLRAILMVKGLHVTSNAAVVLGDDGWLFFSLDRSVENFVCENPYTEEELEHHVWIIRQRARWLKQNYNARYIYTVMPAKETLYPQYMPAYLRAQRQRSGGISRLDQLTNRLKDDPDVLYVDLRPAMLKAAQSERVYQKTDTHCNERGGFVAAEAIIQAGIAAGYLTQPPLTRSGLRETREITKGMDLTVMLGLEDLFYEEELGLQAKITADWINRTWRFEVGSDRLRLLMFGDSFLGMIAPYMAPEFAGGAFIQRQRFSADTVIAEKPSIVITEVAERLLSYPEQENVPYP